MPPTRRRATSQMTACVLIDACVLYPTVLRELVLGVAGQGLFTPLWSPRILGEWQHAAARLGPDGAVIAAGEIALLRARWPGAEVADADIARAGRDFDTDLPDPDDSHVLAAAIAGGASAILTQNLRDFPARRLAPHGVQAIHPDPFLLDLWRRAPAAVGGVVAHVQAEAERISGRTQPLRTLLRRSRLPRLAKALDGAQGGSPGQP